MKAALFALNLYSFLPVWFWDQVYEKDGKFSMWPYVGFQEDALIKVQLGFA